MQKLVSKPYTNSPRSRPERRFSVLRGKRASHPETAPLCSTRSPPRIYRHQEAASPHQLKQQAETILRHLDAIECNVSAEPSAGKFSGTEPSWHYTVKKRTKDTVPSNPSHSQKLYRVRHYKSADELHNADAADNRPNPRRIHRSKTYLGHRDHEELGNDLKPRSIKHLSNDAQSMDRVHDGRASNCRNMDNKSHQDYDQFNVESREDPITRKHVIRIRFPEANENSHGSAVSDYHRPISKNIIEKEKKKTFFSESRYQSSRSREPSDKFDHSKNLSNETRERLDGSSDRPERSRFRSASPVYNSSRFNNWAFSRVREYSRSPSPPPVPVLPERRSQMYSNQNRRRTSSCVNIIHDKTRAADNGRNCASKLKVSHSFETHPTPLNETAFLTPSRRSNQDKVEHQSVSRMRNSRDNTKYPDRIAEKKVYKPKENIVRYIEITHAKDDDSENSKRRRSITRTLSNNKLSGKDASYFNGNKLHNDLSNQSFSSLKNLPKSEDSIHRRRTYISSSRDVSSKRPYVYLSKRASEPLNYDRSPSYEDNNRVPKILSRSLSHDHQIPFNECSGLLDQRDGSSASFFNHNNSNRNGNIYRSGSSRCSDTSETCDMGQWSSHTLPTKMQFCAQRNSDNGMGKSKVNTSSHHVQSEYMNGTTSRPKAEAANQQKLSAEDKLLKDSCYDEVFSDQPGKRSVGVQYNGYSPRISQCDLNTADNKSNYAPSNKLHYNTKNSDNPGKLLLLNRMQNLSKDPNLERRQLLNKFDSKNGHNDIPHGCILPVGQNYSTQVQGRMKTKKRADIDEKGRSLLRPSHTFIVRSDSDRSSTSDLSDAHNNQHRSELPATAACFTSSQTPRERCGSHGSGVNPASGRLGANSYSSSFVSNISTTSSPSRSSSPALRHGKKLFHQASIGDKVGSGFVQRFMEREPIHVSERRDGFREPPNIHRIDSMKYSRNQEVPPWHNHVDKPVQYGDPKKGVKDQIDSPRCANCKIAKQKSPKSNSWKISRVLKYFSPSVRNKKQSQDLSAKSAYNLSNSAEVNTSGQRVYMAYSTPLHHSRIESNVGNYPATTTLQKRHENIRPAVQRSNSTQGTSPHATLHRTDRRCTAREAGVSFDQGPDPGGTHEAPGSSRRSVYLHATTVADIPVPPENLSGRPVPPPPARRVRRSFSLLGLWGGAKSSSRSGTTYHVHPVRTDVGDPRSALMSSVPGGPWSACEPGAGCAACRHGHFDRCLTRCRPLLVKTNSA